MIMVWSNRVDCASYGVDSKWSISVATALNLPLDSVHGSVALGACVGIKRPNPTDATTDALHNRCGKGAHSELFTVEKL